MTAAAEAEPKAARAYSDQRPELYRFSVEKYHALIEAGILKKKYRCELFDGRLIQKEKLSREAAGRIAILNRWLAKNIPEQWMLRNQSPVTFDDSEPQPDLAVVRTRDYGPLHPGPGDIGLVVEVSEETLKFDRKSKLELYAWNGIPNYWIINLPDRQVEVYGRPAAGSVRPKYGRRKVYRSGEDIPLFLEGEMVAAMPILKLFKSKESDR